MVTELYVYERCRFESYTTHHVLDDAPGFQLGALSLAGAVGGLTCLDGDVA